MLSTDTPLESRLGGGRLARAWRGLRRDLGAGLSAADPGWIALKRGARGALAFGLTVLLVRGAATLTEQDPLAMGLGFSVSIFGAVVAREAEQRARLLSTWCLFATAGASFCVSALLTNRWLNHAAFVAVVFAVVYARRWGDRASAAGFGAFSSFFLAAFLSPSARELPGHLLGLALAALAVLGVQVLIVPQRPLASARRIQRALALQIDAARAALGRGGERSGGSPRRALARLELGIRRARAQLEAVIADSARRDRLAVASLRLETAAEALSRHAGLAAGERAGRGAALDAALAELRDALGALGAHALPEGGRVTAQPRVTAELGDTAEPAVAGLDAARDRAARDADPLSPAAPPPAVPLQARLAIQAGVACALAILAGEWLSPERWYWAVITVFVMFTGTVSRGDAIYKSLQRMLGTVLGVVAGLGLVSLVGDARGATFSLLLASIFATYYFFSERFAVMSFFLTITFALLFSLLRRFSGQLLWLRLEETALGALSGILVAAVLLPWRTRSHARDRLIELLGAADRSVSAALDPLPGDRLAALGAPIRAYQRAQDEVLAALRPLRLVPGPGFRRLYAEARDGLRQSRASLRALLGDATPAAGVNAAATCRAHELLYASFRRELGALAAWVRARDGAPAREADRHPPDLAARIAAGPNEQALAAMGARDPTVRATARRLRELVRDLSRVAAAIDQAAAGAPPPRDGR